MQDLPISPAAPTANPVAAGGAPAESTADTTTENFGEVLAREIVTATEKLDPKAKGKLSEPLLGETVADTSPLQTDPTLALPAATAAVPHAHIIATEQFTAPVITDTTTDLAKALQPRSANTSIALPDQPTKSETPAQTATHTLFSDHLKNPANPAGESLPFPLKLEDKATPITNLVRKALENSDASAQLQASGTPVPNASTHRANLPQLHVSPQVGSPTWGDAVGQKIVWMVNDHTQVAELHLNPPELGPITVTLTITDDKTSAAFVSAHASARDAIETAMPKLRDMLADSGITLGNTTVSAESFSQQSNGDQARNLSTSPAALVSNDQTHTILLGPRGDGLVDTFA